MKTLEESQAAGELRLLLGSLLAFAGFAVYIILSAKGVV
jgi:hypothetical protein